MSAAQLLQFPAQPQPAQAPEPTPVELTDHRAFARIGYIAIAVCFGAFGLWASLAPLGSAAVANATVAVSSDKKVIQHLEGGIVREVLVTESQRVKQGQILFRLQPVQAQANADILKKQLDGALAQEARLAAERDRADRISFPPELLARRSIPETSAAMFDQDRQFAERRRSIEAQVRLHQSRIDQTQTDITGKVLRESSLKSQQANLASEIAAVSSLADKGFYPRNKLLANQREMFRIEGELAVANSDIARSREIIEESRQQIRIAWQRQVEEASQQLGDVRARLSDIKEKLQIAADVLSRVEVKASQDGIVQGLKVTMVGAVVRPGEPMAEIVTLEDGLLMSAKITPNDIDSVHAGQKAEIRFPAFASRQTTATLGRVETIAADATFDQATKQTFYLARVSIDTRTLPKELLDKLVPGMPASVIITTSERTVLQYLIGPLFDRLAKTMRER